jgi:hypothetical protein
LRRTFSDEPKAENKEANNSRYFFNLPCLRGIEAISFLHPFSLPRKAQKKLIRDISKDAIYLEKQHKPSSSCYSKFLAHFLLSESFLLSLLTLKFLEKAKSSVCKVAGEWKELEATEWSGSKWEKRELKTLSSR